MSDKETMGKISMQAVGYTFKIKNRENVSFSFSATSSVKNREHFQMVCQSINILSTRLAGACTDPSGADKNISLSEEEIKILKGVLSKTSEEVQKEFQEIVVTEPSKVPKIITFDRACTLIMLFLTLLNLFYSRASDAESKELMRKEIELYEKQVEATIKLTEAIKDATDNANDFAIDFDERVIDCGDTVEGLQHETDVFLNSELDKCDMED